MNIHRRKLFGGRTSAEKLWAETLDEKCRCGNTAMVRITVYALAEEWVEKYPLEAAMIAGMNPAGNFVPTMRTRWGTVVKWSDTFWCALCSAGAERAAAHHPSWCFCDIDRGPSKDRPIVQVSR